MALHMKIDRPAMGAAFVRVQPWTGNYARLTPDQAREAGAKLAQLADEAERAQSTPRMGLR